MHSLQSALVTSLMLAYQELLLTRSETQARNELRQLVRVVLRELDLDDDLSRTARQTYDRFRACSDKTRQKQLYAELQVLNEAIRIMEEHRES